MGIGIGLALLVGVMLVVVLLRQQAALSVSQTQVGQQSSEVEALRKECQALAAELHELRAGSIGMGQRIKQLESRQRAFDNSLRETREQQQELAEMDPDTKLYNRAVKLLQQGASVDELMHECELPRAEAELLFSIHGKQS
ncbi:DUF2802 domain-containing protein [Bowmanella sp. Y57]|uniref:DUF2802 domain-containing protein n=1 Tax=Bowmanella yangjiangensis TaxID=2811230 RepID=A0ABS3D049_9ALTE|nr:DUF2802 domain-containing protein [Bowmanella yangjiangensis]